MSLQAAQSLCRQLGVHLPWHWLNFTGDPLTAINSSFSLGTLAQITIGLSGLSAANVKYLRNSTETKVSVNARHAVLAFASEAYYTVNGNRPTFSMWDPLSGLYKTQDGYVRLHANFPHHKQGLLHILHCEKEDRQVVSEALSKWKSEDLETEAAAHGMCATAFRSWDQWDAHPHRKSLIGATPVEIIKVGDAPKRVIDATATNPLGGLSVLDLTRVLAGPTCGRALAGYGADVLWIRSPNLPNLPLLDVDTSRGKRAVWLDLIKESDCIRLREMVQSCDVFLQSYRPGGLQAKGFGVRDLIEMRPGIVCANITAYGFEGPWRDRRGFDSLVQTATGLNHAEGEAYAAFAHRDHIEPKPFPMQALDHAAGYLLAFGINVALARTITEGGSWEVRVSLAGVSEWLRSLGRVDPEIAFGKGAPLPISTDLLQEEVEVFSEASQSMDGLPMTSIKHAAILSE